MCNFFNGLLNTLLKKYVPTTLFVKVLINSFFSVGYPCNVSHTLKELTTFRADYMNAKTQAYATISTEGRLSEKDMDIEKEDSLAKNMLNYYMISAGLYTNILNKDYMLPSTISGKERRVTREVES